MCRCLCVVFSRTQKSAAPPSTEADYVAMAEGIKKAIFLRYICSFIFPGIDVGCTAVREET